MLKAVALLVCQSELAIELLWVLQLLSVIYLMTVILSRRLNILDDRHFNILGIYDCYLCYTLVTLELPQQVESGIKN